MPSKKQSIEYTISKLANAYAEFEKKRTRETHKKVVLLQSSLRDMGYNVVLVFETDAYKFEE
jgi:hypothetical protein